MPTSMGLLHLAPSNQDADTLAPLLVMIVTLQILELPSVSAEQPSKQFTSYIHTAK